MLLEFFNPESRQFRGCTELGFPFHRYDYASFIIRVRRLRCGVYAKGERGRPGTYNSQNDEFAVLTRLIKYANRLKPARTQRLRKFTGLKERAARFYC